MERSTEVEQFVERFFKALGEGDADYVEQAISDDADVRGIGTDPDEWWQGRRFVEIWKKQIDAMGGGMPVSLEDPEGYAEGSVAWAAGQPRFHGPDGDVAARWTAVLHREGEDWRFVQMHASIGAPNEEALGEELPT